MKRSLCVVCFGLLMSLSVAAQNAQTDVPRLEAFGGYTRNIGEAQGWNGSVAVNANKWLGAVSDFSQLTSTNVDQNNVQEKARATTYLFGPQFSYRGNRRVTPFVRVLLGVANIKAKVTLPNQTMLEVSDTNFSYAAGGGLDIRINKNISIRAIQADYIHTKAFNEGMHNGRLSFGVVFNFGKQ